MAAKILKEIPGAEIEQIEGDGGDFIVVAAGQKLWDKNGSDIGFPDEGAMAAKIARLI